MAKTSGVKARTAAPRAKRAVVGTKGSHAHEDHIDACDLEFRDDEATPDAELPAAKGGVEIVGRKGARRASRRT